MPTSRAPFADVVAAVRERTSLLLGLTIGFSAEDWAAPTTLPGWTRSHVAAHLIDGAQRYEHAIDGLHFGRQGRLHASGVDERIALEMTALASGLDLQIQLDTSASRLLDLLPELEGDSTPVEISPLVTIPAWQIPLARLGEVVVHHTDLAGSHALDLPPETAVSLLAFEVERYAESPRRTALRLVADEGYVADIDGPGDAAGEGTEEVRGPAADLIVWLTRRIASPRLIRSWS